MRLHAVLEAATGAVLLAAWAATAYPLAAWITPRHRLSHRLCAAAILAWWYCTALFYAATGLTLFRPGVVVTLSVGVAAGILLTIGRRPAVREVLADDMRAAGALLRGRPGLLVSLATMAVGAVFALRVVKGLIAPPLAWDGLTYHLVRAARWVQHGSWARDTAPDAWRYYEYFPPGGDLIWAWAMLPAHSDAYVAVAGGLAWLVGVLGAYGAARALHAAPIPAWTTALALGAMPCILGFVTSTYVTGPLLAALLLALTFLLLAMRSAALGDAALAAAALGLAGGIQSLALPLLAVGVTVLVVAREWQRGTPSLMASTAVCLLASAPMLTGYAVAWLDTGSPLYPLSLVIGGTTIFAGNEQLAGVFSGAHLNPRPSFDPDRFTEGLVHGVAEGALDHLNFGPGAIVLALLGVVGLLRFLIDRRRWPWMVPLLAYAAIPLAGLMSDAMLTQRTMFAPIVGRLIAPSLAALALMGSVWSGPVQHWLRLSAVGLGVAWSLPASIADVEVAALAQFAPYAAGGLLVAGLGAVVARTRPRPMVAWSVAGVVAASVLACGVDATRDTFRAPIYAATTAPAGAPYDIVPIHTFLAAADVWAGVDGDTPSRIAVAAGWDGFNGHTVFRYPLFGRRLQNSVEYVPATRDGSIVDYQRLDRLLPAVDFEAWLRRLLARRIDYVVVAVPGAPELDWMRSHPAVFEPFHPNGNLWTSAFRIHTTAAQALLSARDR